MQTIGGVDLETGDWKILGHCRRQPLVHADYAGKDLGYCTCVPAKCKRVLRDGILRSDLNLRRRRIISGYLPISGGAIGIEVLDGQVGLGGVQIAGRKHRIPF